MVNATEAGHDPDDHEGFTKEHLEVLSRFRDTAVDDHLDTGNLDGTGANPNVKAHIKGVVDQQTLLNQYELPVVMSIPTGGSSDALTTGSDETTFRFSISAWVSDYDQAYGLELAQVIIGNVVNNVEANRSLESTPGAGDPIATDAKLAPGPDAVQYDFALNVDSGLHLKFGTADFVVETKRLK